MKYRQLDSNGDYVAGMPYLANTPQTVGQAVLTRLKLWQGEWFVDTTDGTPYLQGILGKTTRVNPDVYIKQRILGTPGVTAILSYSSTFNGGTRSFTVSAEVSTLYSVSGSNSTSLSVSL